MKILHTILLVIGLGGVYYQAVDADGATNAIPVDSARKTGRHFPQIAEVLEHMKGE